MLLSMLHVLFHFIFLKLHGVALLFLLYCWSHWSSERFSNLSGPQGQWLFLVLPSSLSFWNHVESKCKSYIKGLFTAMVFFFLTQKTEVCPWVRSGLCPNNSSLLIFMRHLLAFVLHTWNNQTYIIICQFKKEGYCC